MRQIEVFVLVPPRVLLLDVAGPLEVLRLANQLQTKLRFEVRYAGPGARLHSSIGLTLADIEPLPERLPAGAWLILAGDVENVMTTDAPVRSAAPRADDAPLEKSIVDWLRAAVGRDHTLISICSGALLAARSGLLDGRACTTHYLCCAELARLAPRAKVQADRLYVEDGHCYSSAGITTGIDLMLHLVAKFVDRACVVAIARYLVVYLRRSGNDPQLSPWLEGRNHIHPAVHRVQDAIAQEPGKSWTAHDLAQLAGVSTRHLSRLFHQHAGVGVSEYTNRLRIALAQELLRETRLDMEHVAERAGFASSRQLRRAWRRLHSTPPRQERLEFAARH
jgi:transcriptional regulator GlxA family with amidase domain